MGPLAFAQCPPAATSSAPRPTRDTMGKVHGSLARAGKVRGQTPKVEAQDKKKLPKGRAMPHQVQPPFCERRGWLWQEEGPQLPLSRHNASRCFLTGFSRPWCPTWWTRVT